MDEKRYPLTLPCGNESCKLTKKVTQAEASDIREQCEKIEAQPKPTTATAAEQPWPPGNGRVEYIHKPGVEAYYIGPCPMFPSGHNHVIWVAGEGYTSTVKLEELRPFLPELKKRQWQDGDVVQRRVSGALRVRINKTWCCSGGCDVPDTDIEDRDTYLFNIADVLAQGRIVLGLREDEIQGGDPWIVWNKANSALAAYRQIKDAK